MEEIYENNRVDRYDEKGKCQGFIHVVRRGESLYSIAERYHISLSRLMFANPYVNVYQLQLGDELCIPTVEQENINNL